MPMLRARVFPGDLVLGFGLKESVGDAQVMICTELEQSLAIVNSFNKTEAAVFSFSPCFPRASLSSV